MRIGSLFSGAGGLDLAAREIWPSAEIAWHSEIDPGASRVLAHHWPDTPNLGDITAVDWAAVEPVDILIGGFPCQDVSAAGRRAGLTEGSRSGLWSHMATAVAALRPRWVLIENVKGLLNARAHRPLEPETDALGDNDSQPVLRALGAVLGDLADLGFDAEWVCIRASDIGACHRRERVFVLAYTPDAAGGGWAGEHDGAGRQAACGGGQRIAGRGAGVDASTDSDGAGSQGPQPARRHDVSAGGDREPVALLPTPRASDGTKGGPNQRGSSGDLMLPSAVMQFLPTPRASDADGGPNPLSRAERMDDVETRVIRLGDQWGDYAPAIARHEAAAGRPAPSPTEESSRGNQRLSPAFAEWMMLWPQGHVTEPEIGLSRNEMLRCIGNGVVPPQAVAAGRRLLARVPQPEVVPSEYGEQFVLPIGADLCP